MKQIRVDKALVSKTTNLHVHHIFLYVIYFFKFFNED